MPGHGLRRTSLPPDSAVTGLPASLTISGWTPKNGIPAEPGLQGMAPGRVVIMMLPVSVCHQVSTIGHFSLPMTL